MPERTVLVTGGGGFIGGRVVEVVHSLGFGHVRAGLRRWASGARVGRFPVELVQCDVRDPGQVKEALRGVTHVVHCAVAADPQTTVEGTRTILEAALGASVERVVHLSTIDVYGTPEGEVTEAHPLKLTGRAYGDAKVKAEQAAQALAKRGLPLTILRPTLVHGPFSATWTIAYTQRLQARPWLVPEAAAQGTCNLLYVDDLVGSILAALQADTAPGEAFNVNGPERPTWNDYFHGLNHALGLPPVVAGSPARSQLMAQAMRPVRSSAKLMLKYLGPQIMAAYSRSELARRVMKAAESRIRNTPVPDEYSVLGRRVSYSSEKAERILGYRPRFPMAEALPLTAAWLRTNGFVRT